jgi:hypothetical protein
MKFAAFYEEFVKECRGIPTNQRGKDLVEERAIKLWTSYQIIETNRKLVFATWFLAILTIFLSIINVLFL